MTATSGPAHRGLLQAHPIFGQLTSGEIDLVLASTRVVHYRAKEAVFAKGGPGDAMYAVLTGAVRISVPAADGREVELDTIRPGELFGEIALLDGQERSADATAAMASSLLAIDRVPMLALLHRRPELAVRLLVILCGRLRQATQLIEDLLFLDRPARLAKKLLDLAGADGVGPVRLKVSQRRLGAMIGLSRESINKQIGIWQRAGIVQVAEGAIVIADRAGLRRILDQSA